MTAREKFRVNQRVRLTAAGQGITLRHRAAVPPDTGVGRGFGVKPELVRVQRDGRKTVTTYHMDFWEPVA